MIGGKWALWVGSVAVFFAVAFFLAYTWHYLGNAGRLSVGLLAGTTFLGAGGWARACLERWFGEGLTGAGLAILYLSLWAGYHRYGLLGFDLAFALMTVNTALGIVLALRYDARSLSALATLGGFLTPVLLRSPGGGAGQSFAFLSYVTLLNAGILCVSLFKPWQGITWLSFVATLLLLMGWAVDSYAPAQRWLTFGFVTADFFLFLGSACFFSLIREEETKPEELLLLLTSAFVYAVAGQALLQGALGDYPGVFPSALAVFFGLLAVTAGGMAPANRTLRDCALGLAIFFVTITLPIQGRRGWIAVGWSVEAAVLLTLGHELRSALLTRAGRIVRTLSLLSILGVLLWVAPEPRGLFVNDRASPLLVSVLTGAWLAWKTGREQSEAGDQLATTDVWSPLYAVYAVLGGAWLIAQETFLGFRWRHPAPRDTWESGALFLIAGLWAVYALAAFAAGCRLQRPPFRHGALAVALLAPVLVMGVSLTPSAPGWVPFANPRGLAFAVVVLALGLLAAWIARVRAQLEPFEADGAAVLGWIEVVLLLWGVTGETYGSFHHFRDQFGARWDRAAQMGVSLVWTMCGVLSLMVGVARSYQPLRLFGLGLLGLTVGKVFLLDLSFLDMPYRVFSFGALGLALIGISWLYGRYGIGRAA